MLQQLRGFDGVFLPDASLDLEKETCRHQDRAIANK